MSILPQLASLWIGPRLSWFEQLCLVSFVNAGHDVTLYSYQPIDNLPPGVHGADAAEVYPGNTILRHSRIGSPAIHADLWRLALLRKTEKVWIDTDLVCVRPMDIDGPHIFGWEKPGTICNAVLGLPPDSPALRRLIELFEDEYVIAPWLRPWRQRELKAAKEAGKPIHITEQDWGFTGPASVSWALKQSGEIEHALSQAAFYPIPFGDRNHLIRTHPRVGDRVTEDTYAVHLWARRLKPRLEEKEGNRPRPGSWLEAQIELHGIDVSAAPIPPRVTPEERAEDEVGTKE